MLLNKPLRCLPTAASNCVADPSATPCLSSVPGLFTSVAVGVQHVGKGRTEDEQAKNQVLMLLAVVRLPQVRMGTKGMGIKACTKAWAQRLQGHGVPSVQMAHQILSNDSRGC